MAKWVKWADNDVQKEGSPIYGDGPFVVTNESSEFYYVLCPIRMPKQWFDETDRQEYQEKTLAMNLGFKAGGGCKGTCHNKDEPHPLAGLKGVKADPAHVQKSPYTSQYSLGDPVMTPQGQGVVQEVRWRQLKVGGVLWDWQHISKLDT